MCHSVHSVALMTNSLQWHHHRPRAEVEYVQPLIEDGVAPNRLTSCQIELYEAIFIDEVQSQII